MKIRKMDMSDIEFVFSQEKEIFGRSLGKKTLINEILYNDLAYYLVALKEGKRVAYIGSWLTIPNAEIINLFTLSEFRQQGIAKSLLNTVIKYCKDKQIKKLTLEVRESNKVAKNFYEKMQFNTVTKRKKYYQDTHEDALLMMLELE